MEDIKSEFKNSFPLSSGIFLDYCPYTLSEAITSQSLVDADRIQYYRQFKAKSNKSISVLDS